jgi:hypothetical protein
MRSQLSYGPSKASGDTMTWGLDRGRVGVRYMDSMTGDFSFNPLLTLSTPVINTTTCQYIMPRGKLFDAAEKSKILAWYF